MINVILISDIKIYCEGLSQALSNTKSIKVIGSVDNVDAAIRIITNNTPDVVLQDMTMTGSCSLVKQISSISPNTKIVALAVPYDEDNILLCAEAGITGYVPREASLGDLVEALISAVKGECYCPPRIAACILKKIQYIAVSTKNKYLSSVSDNKSNTYECLTRREQQIAALLSNGLSNKQIARDLSIEVSTVKNHVHNVLVKLDVRSRTQAVSLIQQLAVGPVSRSMDLDTGL